jgi:hypothetical protein
MHRRRRCRCDRVRMSGSSVSVLGRVRTRAPAAVGSQEDLGSCSSLCTLRRTRTRAKMTTMTSSATRRSISSARRRTATPKWATSRRRQESLPSVVRRYRRVHSHVSQPLPLRCRRGSRDRRALPGEARTTGKPMLSRRRGAETSRARRDADRYRSGRPNELQRGRQAHHGGAHASRSRGLVQCAVRNAAGR